MNGWIHLLAEKVFHEQNWSVSWQFLGLSLLPGACFFLKECLITCKVWKHLNRKIIFSFNLPCTDWHIQVLRDGNIFIENSLKAL